MVTHQLQVEHRTGKVRRSKTDVLLTVPQVALLVAFQGVQKEALHVTANWWQFLTLLKQGKLFFSSSFDTLRLCRRDLKILVCLLTGYNILNW